MFGSYTPIDNTKLDTLLAVEEADANIIKVQVDNARTTGKSQALFKVNILPLIMLITFIGLILYFKSKGGYKPVELEIKSVAGADAADEVLPE